MIGPHPEHALFALLLPGAVFCTLMFMGRKKHRPRIVIRGFEVPIWLIYVTVFFAAPILLIMTLIDSIKRS